MERGCVGNRLAAFVGPVPAVEAGREGPFTGRLPGVGGWANEAGVALRPGRCSPLAAGGYSLGLAGLVAFGAHALYKSERGENWLKRAGRSAWRAGPSGPDDQEVASIERGNLRRAETLRNGDERRIDHPKRQVGVLGDQRRGPPEVVGRELFDPEVAVGKLGEEPGFGRGPKAVLDQVAGLDHDTDRHHERARKPVQ